MNNFDSQEALRLRDEVADLMDELVNNEASIDMDEPDEVEILGRAESVVDKQETSKAILKAVTVVAEERTAAIERKTRALREGQVEVWKDVVDKLKQKNFDAFILTIMEGEEEGTLDRFRKISSEYRKALYNVEKETVENRLNSEIAFLRNQYQEELQHKAQAEDHAKKMTSELNKQIQEQGRDKQKLEDYLSSETRRAGDLSKQVLERRVEQLGIALFFMSQSGQVQDPEIWIPFVKAVSETRFMAASRQAVGEDRAWTVVQPWFEDSNALPNLPTDLMSLLIRLHGRLHGDIWADESIETVRVLTIQLEQAAEAPVTLIEKVVREVPKIAINKMRTQLVCFGLWQLARIVQRRWDGQLARLAYELEDQIVGLTAPLRALRDLLGDDCGRQLKALIRARQDPNPGEVRQGDSAVAAALAVLPVQFCPEQDIGLLSLPESKGYIWATDLRNNTIRAIQTSRSRFVDLRWRLVAINEEEDVHIPSDTFRDMDWAMAYLDM
ncbi:hypothetical protein F4811DRAFT_558625 [Daldinia bambusicola]|nr:hypothetical protein F4811DRAFT_558625 [Daldinia bambusicola]